MKILLLSPVHSEYEKWSSKKIKGIPYYQGQASWVKALEKLGNRVSVFIYNGPVTTSPLNVVQKYLPDIYAKFRRRLEKYYFLNFISYLRSERLKKDIKIFKPDLVLISGGITTILPNVFNNVDSKIYLLSGVNPETSSTDLERKLIKEKTIDLVVENDRGYAKKWKKLGDVRTIVLPISSVDPQIHKRVALTKQEKKDYGADVVFIGSITQDRLKKIQNFTKFNFKFWGDLKPGVKLPKNLQKYYMGLAYGEKMIKVLNAGKIILNFQPEDMKSGGNMRTFEILGCGAFELADKADSSWFKNGEDLILFGSLKEAVKQIKYYLKNDQERIKIAANGHRKALKEHSYERHFKNLLQKA